MSNIEKHPAAMTDEELLEMILDDIPNRQSLPRQNPERWARLWRDCEARRARQGFKVVT